jgi:8-oxo-dGTP diphosphatase
MNEERLKLIASVYLILIRDGKILLLRRANTGYEDGNFSLPAGHLEEGESVREGVIREIREEIAIILDAENLHVSHVMHRKKTDHQRIDFFITTEHFDGEPKNAEPEKCDDLSWFPLDNLPANTIPYIRQAIDAVRRGQTFSEFGW